MKKKLRSLLNIKERQAVGYHKYLFNFLKDYPDFIIIGSQKAATTTLHSILNKHPQLKPSGIKETHFYNMNYERGYQYYLSCFPIKNKDVQTFETTPDYIDHPSVPELLYSKRPNTKLIVTLREPVSRAFSQFNFVKAYNSEERKISFEQALDLEDERIGDALKNLDRDPYNTARHLSNYGYKRKGEYASHLKNWLNYFPLDQFHFIEFSDITLRKNDDVFNKLFDFLEVPVIKMEPNVKKNATDYKSKMNAETFKTLKDYYVDKNKELFKIIGTEYDW